MARKADIGELEQLVLLAALRLEDRAYAPEIARLLEEHAERELSRGTLYAALDRLEGRGLIEWSIEGGDSGGRASRKRRRFTVTAAGVETLAAARQTLLSLWDGLERRFEERA